MRLKFVPASIECSPHALQACAPVAPIPLSSPANSKREGRDRTVPFIALTHPFVFKTSPKSQALYKKVCRDRVIQCSFSSFDKMHDGESSHHVDGLAKSFGLWESEGHMDRFPRAIPKTKGDQDSFLNLRFDFLEPMMLGIRPEVPDWPDRETAIRATIEQKAKCFDIPLSLRMIKKKLQREVGFKEFTGCKGSDYCSVKAAFSSMVLIIVELQSYALHMRESLCHEDLDIAIVKVQKEMHSSFAWLFQQVFSKAPSLMIEVMILVANLGAFSASQTGVLPSGAFPYDEGIDLSVSSISISQPGGGIVNGNEATKTKEVEGEEVDHKNIQSFVSPVSVEVESDGYEEYHRTDLLYQMSLSREPNNPLLLCNYGQFLQLVARDYDRAEECYKRAVQLMPPDAEALSLYANFLWMVRRDLWGAEERFLQALAAEPDNSYYASRYANFLWNTGGEETCYPVSDLPNPNL
ncbi:hypothetical protein F511_04939 [Dorcoceras hygrometricum]|uniref:Uncharacterized protein n=1 Tax=Dorcoceras hygrometricum TaxID=472368 RepID=A0A2Z7BS55_9LAMI|nr:hypothetical protein F511_04939 [Dorcoceras hygrometricum]